MLLLAMVLGCSGGGAVSDRLVGVVRERAECARKLLAIFKNTQNKASLEAASSELQDILIEIVKLEIERMDLRGKFEGSEPSIKQRERLALRGYELSKELNLPQLGKDLEREIVRVNRVPGASEYLEGLVEKVANQFGEKKRDVKDYLRSQVLSKEAIAKKDLEEQRKREQERKERERERDSRRQERIARNDPVTPRHEEEPVIEKDPQEQWLEDLDSKTFFRVEEAFENLNKIDPSTVSDEFRQKVAMKARDVATDFSSFHSTRAEATRALVIWGGEFSEPYLVRVLIRADDKETQNEALKGLLKFKSTKGVEAATKILDSRQSDYDLVFKYLELAGPLAEEPILRNVRPKDLALTQKIVQFLGRHGSLKSFKAFSLLEKSDYYPALKADIDAAREAIRERQKQNK
ncbi:MAG: hypothetical protein PVH19_10825 [Planctomycetia bacterium]